jgi:hypothetical protein
LLACSITIFAGGIVGTGRVQNAHCSMRDVI